MGMGCSMRSLGECISLCDDAKFSNYYYHIHHIHNFLICSSEPPPKIEREHCLRNSIHLEITSLSAEVNKRVEKLLTEQLLDSIYAEVSIPLAGVMDNLTLQITSMQTKNVCVRLGETKFLFLVG